MPIRKDAQLTFLYEPVVVTRIEALTFELCFRFLGAKRWQQHYATRTWRSLSPTVNCESLFHWPSLPSQRPARLRISLCWLSVLTDPWLRGRRGAPPARLRSIPPCTGQRPSTAR